MTRELLFSDFYHKYNATFLQVLINQIKKDAFLIADYGGGDSLLSKEFISQLPHHFEQFQIENIDVDSTLFVHHPRIKNVCADLLTFIAKNRYDYVVCRFLLHYFNEDNQLILLKNIHHNLKDDGYVLLINFVVDDEVSYEIKQQILHFIESNTNISKRTIPTSKQVKKSCQLAGFAVVTELKRDYHLSIADFYKNRFNLTDLQIEELIKQVKTDTHAEAQLCLLLQKLKAL